MVRQASVQRRFHRPKKKRLPDRWKPLLELVPMTGIELVTYSLRVSCSTN